MEELSTHNPDEISLKEIVIKLRLARTYIVSKWLTILFSGLIGGLSGLGYAYFKKPVYIATSTFVLEDSKSGGLGQYAGLASLAGINVSGSGAGGVFQGDNILELYKSRSMIKQALLSSVLINGRSKLLINVYIDFNHLQENWQKDQKTSPILFKENTKIFTRLQDSIITDIVKTINDKLLSVTKPDKKLNIIQVDVATKNEAFSKFFNDKLVQTVNNFYAQTKTKKSYQNVVSLQKQADSVRRVLNGSLSGVASAIDATPNTMSREEYMNPGGVKFKEGIEKL
ncbi:MAG: lipopolysaccharide biosynthesis protein, partial [Sphingobacteriaceae bacterium]